MVLGVGPRVSEILKVGERKGFGHPGEFLTRHLPASGATLGRH